MSLNLQETCSVIAGTAEPTSLATGYGWGSEIQVEFASAPADDVDLVTALPALETLGFFFGMHKAVVSRNTRQILVCLREMGMRSCG